MAENTKISWAHSTHNFWVGCTKVSPACHNCYACDWAKRTGQPNLWTGDLRRTTPQNWHKPMRWNAKAAETGETHRVFASSLSDFFDNQAPDVWREDAWALIRATPHLTWMILTKRPQNINKMLPADWKSGYPNVWLGTTVENQAEAERRIPALTAVLARLRFLSCEPLLGPLERLDLRRIDWVIVGGESGPNARPMHPQWVRSLCRQCAEANVAFHFKQWGAWRSMVDREKDDPDWRQNYGLTNQEPKKYRILNLAGGCGFHGEQVHMMHRVPNEHTAPVLDGINWQGFPDVGMGGE
jgi:protein gp37